MKDGVIKTMKSKHKGEKRTVNRKHEKCFHFFFFKFVNKEHAEVM